MRYRVLALTAVLLFVGCGKAAARVQSGISGLIVAGPTCPVERVPPEPACAPRPLVAALRIWRAGHRAQAKLVTSHANGRFRISLPVGTYTVEALPQANSPFPRPPAPSEVRVSTGLFASITLSYDTGIR